MRQWFVLSAIAMGLFASAGEAQTRHREMVRHDAATIETIVEGEGPLLVLLPSLGRDSEEFDEVAAAIAHSGFRVLRPRPRGFGGSVGPMDDLTIRDFAADIAAVIKSQNAGPAIVAGHAYGHFIAKMTATDFPELVRGVALVAAAQKNIDPKVRAWLAIATDPKQPEAERIKYLQMVFFAPGHDPRPWLTGFDPVVQKSQEVARDKTPQATYWSAGKAPLLDLQAEHDPYRPRATKDQLVDEFGAARVTVEVIPNASHALPVEQPEATSRALVAWAKSLPATPALSSELRLLSSNGIRPAIEALHSAAEKEIGRKLSIEFSSSTLLQKQIDSGAPFDLAILTPGIVEQLAKGGRVVKESIVDIASSDLAVGAKAGTAKADISTAAGMKARLLAARTVTWTDGGAAGPSVLALFEGLGIATQMKPKIVLQQIPGRPAVTVAAGENELMFAPVSEIQNIEGVQVLGKFPQEYQRPVVMTAAISGKAVDADSARKLLAFLTSAKAVDALKATGMDPAVKR